MTYEERQEYFKLKHQQVDKKALMLTQPEREAKMETKRKNREWSENSKVHLQTQFWHPAIAMSFCTHSSAICIPSYGKFMVQLWHIFA
jgi:hypothetical protein